MDSRHRFVLIHSRPISLVVISIASSSPRIICGLKGNGNIFIIKAKIEPIAVTSFDINMDSSLNVSEAVEIYYHPGIAPGFDSQLDHPYTMIFQQNVIGMGKGNVTVLPNLLSPVYIPANATYSFYITTVGSNTTTTTTGGATLWYNVGVAVGDIVASDQYVKIGEGYAVSYPFLNYTKRKRWNGEECLPPCPIDFVMQSKLKLLVLSLSSTLQAMCTML